MPSLLFFFFTLPERLIKETFRHERSVETLRHMLLSEEESEVVRCVGFCHDVFPVLGILGRERIVVSSRPSWTTE